MTRDDQRDYEVLRDATRVLMDQDVGAVDTLDQLRDRFGADQAPTLCTVYKWRREYRDEKGEEHNDQKLPEKVEEGGGDELPSNNSNSLTKKPAGKSPRVRKSHCDKYCVECNREMCSRNYYELHMLKLHNVFLGDSRSLLDMLETFQPARRALVIYRCDFCFGGQLDYDNMEDLKRHRQLEHDHEQGGKMISFSPPNTSILSNKTPNSLKKPKIRCLSMRRSRSVAPYLGRRRKEPDDVDQYSPTTAANLRRSSRIPKPSSALMESMMGQELMFSSSDHSSTSGKTPKKRGIGARKSIGAENLGNGGGKDAGNGEEKFVTIVGDGRIELEEYKPRKLSSGVIGRPPKRRMLSPDALDAADSMLKLAAAAAASDRLLHQSGHGLGSQNTATSSSSAALSASASSPSKATRTTRTEFFHTQRRRRRRRTFAAVPSPSVVRNIQQQRMFHDGLDRLVTIPKKRGRKPKPKLPVAEGAADRAKEKSAQNNAAKMDMEMVFGGKVANKVNKVEHVPHHQQPKDQKDGKKQPNNLPATLELQQDDCTWFGHSVAASLRAMNMEAKERAKMRIQQVIYECATPSTPHGKGNNNSKNDNTLKQGSWHGQANGAVHHHDEGIGASGDSSSSGAGDDGEEKKTAGDDDGDDEIAMAMATL